MIETSRYLKNQIILKEVPKNSESLASEQAELKRWLLNFMGGVMRHDFAEYNSRPYQRYSLVAILNLADFAEDNDVRQGARMVLEYTAAKFAVASREGIRVAPYRRRIEYMNENSKMLEFGGKGTDYSIAMMLVFAGQTQRLPNMNSEPGKKGINYGTPAMMIYTASSTFVADPAIVELAINKKTPYVQRIRHAAIEIYTSGPSFTLAAGGFRTGPQFQAEFGPISAPFGAGLGGDYGTGVPTSLIVSGASDQDRLRFMRFEGQTEDHGADGRTFDHNTCMWKGFTCGINFQIGDGLAGCTFDPGSAPEWSFLNSTKCDATKNLAPFYVVRYLVSCDDKSLGCQDNGKFGFFEIVDAATLPDFDGFRNATVQQNGLVFPGTLGDIIAAGKGLGSPPVEPIKQVGRYQSVATGDLIWFSPTAHQRDSDRSGIEGINTDRGKVPLISKWPFASGDVLNAAGDGIVKFVNPNTGVAVTWDFKEFTTSEEEPAVRALRLCAFLSAAISCVALTSQQAVGLEVDQCASDVAPVGINLATALAAGGKITFRCAAGTTLRITKLHSVNRSVEIDGGGQVTLDGNSQASFLDAATSNLVVHLSNLTLRRLGSSSSTSNGVARADRIIIENTRVLDSQSPIQARAFVSIENSEFDGNRGVVIQAPFVEMTGSKIRKTHGVPILGFGGLVNISDSEFEGNGRSVFQNCTLRIARTSFRNNTTELSADILRPGAALTTGCATEISKSTFSGNKSATHAGAINIERGATFVVIEGCSFDGNSARHHGGAISFEPADQVSQVVQIKFSRFNGNKAETGGAVDIGEFPDSKVTLFMLGVTFIGNVASDNGGAIAGTDGILFLLRSVFKRNEAKSGGAIWHNVLASRPNNPDVIANSLFVLNRSAGGVFNGNTARFLNSTIVGSNGPGLVAFPDAADGDTAKAIHLANTIVENSSGANCKGKPTSFVDQGSNLQFPGTTCGDRVLVAASTLDTFYAPMVGGPARARGDNTVCKSIAVQGHDLYGEKRPQSDQCSIGAVEGDLDRIINRHLAVKAALSADSACPPNSPGKSPDCSKKDNPKGWCPPGSSGVYPNCGTKDSKDPKETCRHDGSDCYPKGKGHRPQYPVVLRSCGRGKIGIPPYCFPISEIPGIAVEIERQLPRY